MHPFMVAALILSGLVSVFLIFRLLSSQRSLLEKCIFLVVLLVPLVGPLLYLFLCEEVPPQPSVLRNTGPRGAYTNWMIAIQAIMAESAHKETDESKEKDCAEDDGRNWD